MDLSHFVLDSKIPDGHLVDVCKYRQGASCCRYIVFFDKKEDFYCVKKEGTLKEKIDRQIEEMTAKGDNCQGL